MPLVAMGVTEEYIFIYTNSSCRVRVRVSCLACTICIVMPDFEVDEVIKSQSFNNPHAYPPCDMTFFFRRKKSNQPLL